jgi:ABC-2 type transport system permease protein
VLDLGAEPAPGGATLDHVLPAEHLPSGFMLPFLGMPQWAQIVGECLPLTHYLRIGRAIMLKGATLHNLQYDAPALLGLMLFAMTIAVLRFRRTLD